MSAMCAGLFGCLRVRERAFSREDAMFHIDLELSITRLFMSDISV